MSWMKILKLVGSSVIDKPLEIIDKQLGFYQQRKNAAQAQQLKQEDARFQQQLELDRQKLNAELDEMIARKEIERNSQRVKAFTEACENHKRTMAQCNISIGRSLGMMDMELYEHAVTLLKDKYQDYSDMQQRALEQAYAHFDKIHAKFPEGSRARSIMEEAVAKQISDIMETSGRFIKTIETELAEMVANVKKITETTVENTEQYLTPIFSTEALRGGNDTKLLR